MWMFPHCASFFQKKATDLTSSCVCASWKQGERTPNFLMFCSFPQTFQFVKILCVPQAFNPDLKKMLGFHTWKNSITKTKQNKKRTSSTKQVFVGKGKHLARTGNSSMLRKHNWEYLCRHDCSNRHPLFAYINSHPSFCSFCWVLSVFSTPPLSSADDVYEKMSPNLCRNLKALQTVSTSHGRWYQGSALQKRFDDFSAWSAN